MTKPTLVSLALQEDAPNGDITTQAIFGRVSQKATAVFWAKDNLVVSGWSAVQSLAKNHFKTLKLKIKKPDGSFVQKKTAIGTVTGQIAELLRFERVALNFLQHLSGVATLTRRFVAKTRGTKARIYDTRKTLPGFRALAKKAVLDGGGRNHRHNLSDQYLIKDNHVDACLGIYDALDRVKTHRAKTRSRAKIEIEVRNLTELTDALYAAPHIILLDNMPPKLVKQAVALRDAFSAFTQLEVSGGLTIENVRAYAQLGVERLSVGALTHSAPAVDISLKIA